MSKSLSVSFDEAQLSVVKDIVERNKPVYKGVSHVVKIALADWIKKEEGLEKAGKK